MSKLHEIPGIRLKFRTEERGDAAWITATIWKDDAPLVEIATLRLDTLDRPGSPEYQSWVDATSAVFHAHLSRISGVPGITGKRKKPRYVNEEE